MRHHEDGPNHFSAPIVPTGGSDGENLNRLLDQHLPWLVEGARPDLLIYQAGADPLRDDPYSPLDLTHEDLFLRDKTVFAFAQTHSLPIAWVLAGGYTPEVEKVVQVHVNTARAGREIYCFS